MPRHVLTVEEQLRGLRRAIASPRTPPHLRKSLERRQKELAGILERRQRQALERKSRSKKRPPGLLDWLGL